jgi:hypothetical protein
MAEEKQQAHIYARYDRDGYEVLWVCGLKWRQLLRMNHRGKKLPLRALRRFATEQGRACAAAAKLPFSGVERAYFRE